MKIAILGSNGFLSNQILHYCYRNCLNIEIDVFGLKMPIGLTYHQFYQLDLVKQNLKCEDIKNYDIIVYCIGAGIQSNLQESNDIIYRLNVFAPVSICNSLENVGFNGVFVTFGSYFEIGNTDLCKPFSEREVLFSEGKASNDYTVSKRILSRYFNSCTHSFTFWHFILPTIYGAGENPQRLIPYTINALLNNQELKFTDGNQVRQYIHAEMIPTTIMNAYENNLSSGIYNIEGNETLSVREIVSSIFGFMNRDLPSDVFGNIHRKDVDMRYLALDGSLLKSKMSVIYNTTILSSISKYLKQ